MSLLNRISDGSRDRQKRDTYVAIVNAARSLFLERGYEATTTRDIASSCGVATGTVFAHFATKQLLLRAVLASGIDEALALSGLTMPASMGGRDALMAYARQLFAFYFNTPDLSRILMRSAMFDRTADAPQADRFVAEIAHRLRRDAPALDDEGRRIPAETMFSTYLSIVVDALGQDQPSAAMALARLEERCRLLLTPYGNAR